MYYEHKNCKIQRLQEYIKEAFYEKKRNQKYLQYMKERKDILKYDVCPEQSKMKMNKYINQNYFNKNQ